MPDELDKSGGDSTDADDGERDRPTVSPPFDPAAFAREAALARPSPAAGTPAVTGHDPHTHATPPQGMAQQAAIAELSRPSLPPERERKTANASLATPDTPPDSIGSIAARRLPSHEMPRIEVPTRPDPSEVASPWGAEHTTATATEVVTRPPPADAPDEDPILEVSTDRTVALDDLDDIDLEEHTGPHLPPNVKPAVKTSSSPPGKLAPTKVGPPTEREMNDRVAVGDYSGALEIAELLLAEDPNNFAVKTCADTCRSVLKQMYATRIGPLHRVPMVAIARDQLRWLSIDHKAGFVLSLVDGVSSLEMIIDVSGMPQLDTLRILSELVQQRIISLR